MNKLIENNIYGFIYKITNTINGKAYVGKHKGTDFGEYWGSGTALHNAYKKYGKENFKREVLKYASFEDELNFMECFYIQACGTKRPNGYNIAFGGKGGYTGEISEESRKKISDFHKGKPKSLAHRLKLSESKKGVPTHKHTDEEKKKISIAHMGIEPWNKGKGKPVDQLTMNGEYIRTWPTMNEAVQNGFSASKICDCINGKRTHHRHFLWRYSNG